MFCPPCKIILDNGAALVQSVTCMANSIILGAMEGKAPPDELRSRVAEAFKEAALAAQEMARHYGS